MSLNRSGRPYSPTTSGPWRRGPRTSTEVPAIRQTVGRRRQRQDRERFEALYTAHRSSIVRYLRRRLGDDAAEDAAAEVFLRAYRRIDTLESSPAEARAWLHGIAEYVVLERWRAEARRLRLLDRVRLTSPALNTLTADHDDQRSIRELEPELVSALLNLSADDRSTLLLTVWGELSYDEVATALDIPVGTVRSRIARARRQLQPVLRPGHTTGGSRA